MFVGPHINLTYGQYKSKLAIGAKKAWSLIGTGGATTFEPRNSHNPLSTLSFWVNSFPLVAPAQSHPQYKNLSETSTHHIQDIFLAHEKEGVLHASGTYHSTSTEGYYYA
jgi:hypothetical protein